MVVNADGMDGGLTTHSNDPRITRVGTILRRTRLDELPQLINIVCGDMALVGPRPTLPFQFDHYTETERARVAMRPGMTGWSQINGGNRISWDERILLDVWYVNNWTPQLDLKILVLTAKEVVLNAIGSRSTYIPTGSIGWSRPISPDPYTHSEHPGPK